MAYAALIENGVVEQVIVIPDGLGDDDTSITEYCNAIGLEGVWIRTADSGFRARYAGEGFVYDAALDQFVAPTVL